MKAILHISLVVKIEAHDAFVFTLLHVVLVLLSQGVWSLKS
jgi:hypothetical protein